MANVKKAKTVEQQVSQDEMDTRIILPVAVSSIDSGARLRPVDLDKAQFLAASIEQSGLMNPVEVRPHPEQESRYILISGGHRLRAHELLERKTIDAVILNISEREALWREIDENIFSLDLTELDRAVFFNARKELYEDEHPETKHGGDRKSGQQDQVAIFGDLIERFTTQAKEKLGMGERTVQRVIARAKLDADLRAKIAFTSIARKGAELDALLSLPPQQRHEAVDLILSGEEDAPKTVAQAKVIITGARQQDDPVAKQFSVLLTAWNKAGKKAQKQFLAHLTSKGICVVVDNHEEAA